MTQVIISNQRFVEGGKKLSFRVQVDLPSAAYEVKLNENRDEEGRLFRVDVEIAPPEPGIGGAAVIVEVDKTYVVEGPFANEVQILAQASYLTEAIPPLEL